MPQVFAPFPTDPPPADQARAALYRAFAHHAIYWGWCSQCFGPEWEARMRAHPVAGTAPLDAFSMILFEHPCCSGGPDTFLHWLPRGMEVALPDAKAGDEFTDRMVQLRVIAWPDAELGPLRAYAARLAQDWFSTGILPSGQPVTGPGQKELFGEGLVTLLALLRFDPVDLARWLVACGSAPAWRALLGRLIYPKLPDPVYFEPEDRDRIFAEAGLALGRRLQSALAGALTGPALLAAWERFETTDPALARDLADAEVFLPGWWPDPDDPPGDLALIARAVAEGPGRP